MSARVCDVLDDSAVAYWNEPTQSYYCKPCRRASKMNQWQRVDEDTANLLAKDCGLTHCSHCDREIGAEIHHA